MRAAIKIPFPIAKKVSRKSQWMGIKEWMGGSAENKKGSLFSLPRLKPRLHGRRKSLLSGGLLNKTRLFSFAVWQLAKLQEEDSGNNDFSYAAYRIWPIAALKGWLSFVSEAECLCFTFSTKSISKRHVPFRMTLVRHFDPGADKDFDGLEGFEPEGSMGYYSEVLPSRGFAFMWLPVV
ncbi:hypothetical protein OIU85_006242 [Salix viminalis]|uniref:Uncharacterized protein n=1 Tax=Salix viminalis TaxID=40686 RepID=A0A9Q0PL88_SALVM|nr:hypothetical protein OIU85_006242 [Salix viminalis]